ncbi:MAG: ribulose-phosphate 3-epimerase [Acidobacteriia bacterium]|nr:ribulose-phosphate 3-epimerase [Terriglobia bacterium]
MIEILPSILSADFANLAEEMRMVEEAGATMLHVDVMDGHFVPNITIGPPVIQCIHKATSLPLDVHLMISQPERYLRHFIDAGADLISVQVESTPHVDRAIQFIKEENRKAGVVLNPATPLAMVEEVLEIVDHVLVMSVNPGFGGQKFIDNSLDKISRLKEMIEEAELDCRIEVDGGIDRENLREVLDAGAEMIVVGSHIFHAPDPAEVLREMLSIAREFEREKEVGSSAGY